MDERNQELLAGLQKQISNRVAYKFTKGQEQHGGYIDELSANSLLENAIDEAIDQCVYLLTLREVLAKNHPADTNDLGEIV